MFIDLFGAVVDSQVANEVMLTAHKKVIGRLSMAVGQNGYDREICICSARVEDSRAVYKWRNDSESRKQSRNQSIVSWETHSKWFSSVIEDIGRVLLIGSVPSGQIGMVRFDSLQKDVWEVSINMSPDFRGQHLSGPFLDAAIHSFLVGRSGIEFVAEIRKGNVASIKLFQGAGFKLAREDQELLHYRLKSAEGM